MSYKRYTDKDLCLKDYQDYTKSEPIKRKLVQQKGHKCEQCLRETWENFLVLLELHHIDSNRLNNQISNVQLLCANCHALTKGYKGRK